MPLYPPVPPPHLTIRDDRLAAAVAVASSSRTGEHGPGTSGMRGTTQATSKSGGPVPFADPERIRTPPWSPRLTQVAQGANGLRPLIVHGGPADVRLPRSCRLAWPYGGAALSGACDQSVPSKPGRIAPPCSSLDGSLSTTGSNLPTSGLVDWVGSYGRVFLPSGPASCRTPRRRAPWQRSGGPRPWPERHRVPPVCRCLASLRVPAGGMTADRGRPRARLSKQGHWASRRRPMRCVRSGSSPKV